VPVLLSLPDLEDRLHGLVLWQPMLDLRETFLEPRLPWALANFGPTARVALDRDGFLLLDGQFELGRALFEEMRHHKPAKLLGASRVPALIVHGDRDTHVSHDTAAAVASSRPDSQFHSVSGSEHGFEARPQEDEALDATVDWLVQRHGR
jgi:uncharacterized protein